jgi:F0F1-type ATP synthase beta subunit
MTPAMPRNEQHHDLVRKGAELIAAEEKLVGGQLGRPSGARFRTYERLKRHVEDVRGTIFYTQELLNAIDEVYRYPLRPVAIDSLNRQLKSGVSDQTLAELVMALREEGRLCVVQDNEPDAEPQIICSLGMFEQAVEQ